MKLNTTSFSLIFLLFIIKATAQHHFPGGVAGAEAWYIVNHDEIQPPNPVYKNLSRDYIKIISCGNVATDALFNFNHSIRADKLCLSYNAGLENTTSRNIFFVGEPRELQSNFSHTTTGWNPMLSGMPQTTSSVKNRFDLASYDSYIDEQYLSYQSQSNAYVNFYHWNIYENDKKLKSYGMQGETSFYIGKAYINPETEEDVKYFSGNFPEYISYPFELTANQKNRVESYLALKYGITLDSETSYKNSKNVVFWNKENNQIFRHRIFGIGRDDISGLNQLQTESVHFKDYLIASVKDLVTSNPEKQALVSIQNNEFIVFGDDGSFDGLEAPNYLGVSKLKRKWLSQNTGDKPEDIPIYFKLNLDLAIKQAMTQDPALKLWMLHDKDVNNQQISDFDSQYVDYYQASSVETDLSYGYFRDIFFDVDNNTYDQFTFGVGPEMIVQVRFNLDDCGNSTVRPYVLITGGRPDYKIHIKNDSGTYDELFITSDTTQPFVATLPDTFTITVTDSGGLVEQVQVTLEYYPLTVDLGPDVVLSATLQDVLLDAGQGVTDPDAAYKWYLNGEELEHYDATLLASEPGEYMVEVTNSDHLCVVTDTVELMFNVAGEAHLGSYNCEMVSGEPEVVINVSGGIPDYTTIFTSITTDSGMPTVVAFPHSDESVTVNGIPFGEYTVSTYDSNGTQMYESTVDIPNPLGGIEVDIAGQIESIGCIEYSAYNNYYQQFACGNLQNVPVILNAAELVTNTNVFYEWKLVADGGTATYIYDPAVELTYSIDYSNQVGLLEVTLTIYNLESGCELTEVFGLIRGTYIEPIQQITTATGEVQMHEPVTAQEEELQPVHEIQTRVYPNPSEHTDTFYFEVFSDEVLTGTVEIFSATGALIRQENITGQPSYKLPFSLLSSGVYLIRTNVNGTILTNQIIIK